MHDSSNTANQLQQLKFISCINLLSLPFGDLAFALLCSNVRTDRRSRGALCLSGYHLPRKNDSAADIASTEGLSPYRVDTALYRL
ncbi:hypothetical protein VTP01DRAFT_8828, partial [Rhizomucor pusillus]|uniref:uncharacterized protein n=1 Tax=Rhizomucor pusillus TaxID=4840 RepID=UPI0037438D6C